MTADLLSECSTSLQALTKRPGVHKVATLPREAGRWVVAHEHHSFNDRTRDGRSDHGRADLTPYPLGTVDDGKRRDA